MRKNAYKASGSLKGALFMGKSIYPLLIIICIQVCKVFALDTDSLGARINLPTFDAQIGVGFNYDLLKNPTDVSFEYPSAYFGFNLPLKTTMNLRYLNNSFDSIVSDTGMFTDGKEFKPTATARQNANVTVRVEVPMLGGVGSFSNIQNVYLKYQNMLGNPNIYMNPTNLDENISFLLRGTINVPLEMSLYWETMTFGYAYKLNKYFIFALNLHRHIFSMDLRGSVDVDMMGKYKIDINNESGGEATSTTLDGLVNYPSSRLYGNAYGHYETEVWSPTLAVKAWRFSLVSRFGIDTRAPGELNAKFTVPFFIDPETFEMKYDFEDTKTFSNPEVTKGLSTNATDSLSYSSNETELIWKMPTALTLSFDVWQSHLRLSYSKLFGEIRMKLDNITKEERNIESGTVNDTTYDSLVFDMGISVDHIIMIECNLFHSFCNIGICAFDVEYNGKKHLLGDNVPYLKFGKSAMLPILNLGTDLGTKLQLHLELDVLPLPALKTGIYYHF